MIRNTKPELFILSYELLDALTREEVDATFEDMVKLGIAKAPYYNFAIQIAAKSYRIVASDAFGMDRNQNVEAFENAPDLPIVFHFNLETLDITREGQYNGTYQLNVGKEIRAGNPPQRVIEGLNKIAFQLNVVLIVLLATKNAVKTVKEHKLAKLGIGKKRNPYVRTTTLTIGKITEIADGKGGHDGSHRRPHLRRGHRRAQRYGPKWEFTKDIFIEPVFVNADEGWIAERTAYNVGKAHK